MTFKSRSALTCCLLCFATSAWSLTCQMTSECYETEACNDTTFAFDMRLIDGAAEVTTDYETYLLSPISGANENENVQSYLGRTSGAVHLLSLIDGKEARYALHMTDGLAQITYAGACEVAK